MKVIAIVLLVGLLCTVCAAEEQDIVQTATEVTEETIGAFRILNNEMYGDTHTPFIVDGDDAVIELNPGDGRRIEIRDLRLEQGEDYFKIMPAAQPKPWHKKIPWDVILPIVGLVTLIFLTVLLILAIGNLLIFVPLETKKSAAEARYLAELNSEKLDELLEKRNEKS